MTQHAFSASTEIGGADFDFEVIYEYYPANQAHQDNFGAPLEPHEPASVSITRLDIPGASKAANDAISDWLLSTFSEDYRAELEETALEKYNG